MTPARLVLVAAAAAVVALPGCAYTPSLETLSRGGSVSAVAAAPALEPAGPFLARLQAAAAEQGTVEVLFSGDTVDGSGYLLLGSEPTGNYVMNMGDTNTELVVVDGTAYYKDGGDFSGGWVSMPAKGAAMARAFTPENVLGTMRAGASGVENLGPDDLYGTPTTMYELVVDRPGAAPASDVQPAAVMHPMPETLYTVWVGEGDLIRRVEVMTRGGGLILEYGRWGESMEVVAPAAEMVTPVSTS